MSNSIAFLLVTLGTTNNDQLIKSLETIEEIEKVSKVYNDLENIDLIVKLSTRNYSDLHKVILGKIKKFTEIKTTETLLVINE